MLRRLGALVKKVGGSAADGLFQEFVRFASSSSILQVSKLASGLVVAAIVGPTEWGAWYLLNLVIAYGVLTQMGALNGMNREVPVALGANNSGRAADLRRSTLGIIVMTTGAALLALVVLSSALGIIEMSKAFLLTLLLLLANQVYAYATMTLRSTARFVELSRLQWVEAVSYPIFAIGLSSVLGLEGFIVGQALSLVLCSAAARRFKTILWRPRLDYDSSRRLIAIGFPIMLVGLMYTMLTTVDRWIVAAFLGQDALGHYSIAIMALSGVGFLSSVISQQFYPRMAFEWSANRNVEALRAMVDKQRTFTFAAVVPVALCVLLAAPPVIRALLPEFAPGIPAIMVTSIAPLLATVGQGYGALLHVLDRQYWYMGALLAAMLVNAGVSILLVDALGLVGVAIGTLAAFALLAALRVVLGGIALRRT